MDEYVNKVAILGLHFPTLVALSDATRIRGKLSWPGFPELLTHEITWVILSHYTLDSRHLSIDDRNNSFQLPFNACACA